MRMGGEVRDRGISYEPTLRLLLPGNLCTVSLGYFDRSVNVIQSGERLFVCVLARSKGDRVE